MKKFLVFMAVILLSACSMQPVQMPAGESRGGGAAFASLADANDPIDMLVAPVLTRLALTNYRLTKLVTDKKISKEMAIGYQQRTRDIAGKLRAGHGSRNIQEINMSAKQLDDIVVEIEVIQ